MRSNIIDSDWMDENDGLQPGITCDIELNVEKGNTPRETAAITAKMLRALARQIESGALDSGFHDLNLPTGEKVGELYLDWHATCEFQ